MKQSRIVRGLGALGVLVCLSAGAITLGMTLGFTCFYFPRASLQSMYIELGIIWLLSLYCVAALVSGEVTPWRIGSRRLTLQCTGPARKAEQAGDFER